MRLLTLILLAVPFLNVSGQTLQDVTTAGATSDKCIELSCGLTFNGLFTGINFKTGSIARWLLRHETIENGSNAGSDFSIHSYNDAGGWMRQNLLIERSTGKVTIDGDVNIGGNRKLLVGGVPVINLNNNGNDIYGNFRVLANHSAIYPDGMYINYGAPGGQLADVRFYADGTNERMIIKAANGNVGIGTPSPDEKLTVNGNIRAKKIKVTLSGWPDYVFSTAYQLPALHQVEEYIRLHQHLPGIPSAAELIKEGLDVGDMQQKQMQKIEELTLYLIEQNKKIATQDDIILKQQRLLLELEKRLEKVEKN